MAVSTSGEVRPGVDASAPMLDSCPTTASPHRGSATPHHREGHHDVDASRVLRSPVLGRAEQTFGGSEDGRDALQL